MRPGTIIYFDLLEDLADFSDEEAGQLLRALLLYGTTGEVPCFSDRGMKAVWRKIQAWADRDSQKYDRAVLQRRYAVYCRKMRQEEQEPLSFTEWAEEQCTGDNEQTSSVYSRQPTRTLTSTSAPTSITTPTLSSTLAQTRTRTSPGMEEEGFGEEKENPQHLTAEQRFEEKRRRATALLQREEGQLHATF